MTALALTRRPAAQLAQRTLAQHSKSFALASRLLDRRVRHQTAIVYTWCRRADDAIDEPDAQAGDAAATLRRLTGELDAVYAGAANDPVLAELGEVVRDRAIPASYPRALLAGLAMDAAAARYARVDDVIAYAFHVAGVVGLMMTHVFGVADDAALVPAAHLGIAMQLTNIARDVAEDWARGRLYLPDDLLASHGAAGLAGDLDRALPASAHRPIANARAELLAIAERYYRSGDRGIAALPWRPALAVAAARRLYAAIGARMALTAYDVAAGRAVVPLASKLALVGAAAARLVGSAPRRLWRPVAPRIPTRVLERSDVPAL